MIRSRDERAMQIFKEMEDRFSVLLGSDSDLALNFHALKGHVHLQLGEYEVDTIAVQRSNTYRTHKRST